MSLKRMSWAIAFLAALHVGTGLFSQEYSPGRPDDLAALLPEETVLFAEVAAAPKLLRDWKEYAGAFCTKEGKANVVQTIEKAFKDVLDALPEKLVKDFEKGFPTVQRIAVAMGGGRTGEEPFAVFVASASGEEFFKALTDDLKTFAADEKPHQGATILSIRKLGRNNLGTTVSIAALGKRLVASSNLASVMAVLDRAAGKADGGDLRKNPAYARFAPAAGDDASLRAFANLGGGGFMDLLGGRSWSYRRASAYRQDVVDAALGLRKIRVVTLEAALKPGKVTATTRIAVDPGCPLFEIWRQPAGPKETLKLIPAEAQLVAHVNLKSGQELSTELQKLMARYSDIDAKASASEKPEFRRNRGRMEEEFKNGFERQFGVPLDATAALLGNEAAFAMVGDDAFAGQQNMVNSLLFVFALTDAEKAREVLEKFTQKQGPYETKKEGDATFYIPAQEGTRPVFALQGKTGLIAGRLDVLKLALKAAAEGSGIAKHLPAGAAGASKLIGVRNSALWSLLRTAGPGMPDLSKDLDLGALSIALVTEEKEELRITSSDAGLGMSAQGSVLLFPSVFVASSPRVYAEAFDEAGKKEEPLKEAAPLPADKLEAEVKKHLAGMRSDEVVAREDSETALKALGPQASKLLAEAVRKETDAEVKGRILGILSGWKAYDAFPELLKSKVDGFVASFEKQTSQGAGRFRPFVQWRQQGMSDFPYGMEPGWWDTTLVRRCEHRDLLESPQGVRALVERMAEGKLNPVTLRNLCAMLAFTDCGAAGETILAAREKLEDAEAKTFLQIALGWPKDAKSREALHAGLASPDVWIRRASFLGIERSKDPAAVPKLLELLGDKDYETRWNASYTLREVTASQVGVNVFLPDTELAASLAAARAWWEKNKATFKP
jgi:HEAT repeat protein